jgi:hypothetical protein
MICWNNTALVERLPSIFARNQVHAEASKGVLGCPSMEKKFIVRQKPTNLGWNPDLDFRRGEEV